MRVGIPREVKNHEYRVAITPSGVNELVRDGHRSCREGRRGRLLHPDDDYIAAGAQHPGHRRRRVGGVRPGAQGEGADRGGVPPPRGRRPGAVHLPAPGRLQGVHGRAGDVRRHRRGVRDGAAADSLPLLAPMPRWPAGWRPRSGPTTSARGWRPRRTDGWRVRRLRGEGRRPRGRRLRHERGGDRGRHAGRGLLLDKNVQKLREADRIYQGHVQTVASNAFEVERAAIDADLVIGAVLIPGAKAPTLISNELA